MTEKTLINKADDGTARWQFAGSREALVWSTEVLRRRRLPQLSAMWAQLVPPEALERQGSLLPVAAEGWEQETVTPEWQLHLPRNAEDRYALALDVAGVLATMGAAGELLTLQAWGDWATEARLRRALAMQESLRRQGVRMLVNYRYTFRQLAEMEGTDAKTMWRRVRKAMAELERRLATKGLVWRVEAARTGESLPPRAVGELRQR